MGKADRSTKYHTGLNLSHGYAGLTTKQATLRQARMDSTALLAAKMVEAVEGNSEGIGHCMGELIDDPERLGAATLSLLNLVFALQTQNGTDLQAFKKLIDYNIKTLRDSN